MPPKQKKPQVGIVFPPGPKGDRSTSAAGKGIIGASLKAVDAEAAAKCEKERNWRYGYNKHFLKHVKLGCSTPAAALAGAKAGLDYVYDNFEFIAKEGDAAVPLRDEMKTNKTSFCTGKFQGSGDRKGIALTIPYNGGYTQANQTAPTDKDLLKGTALKEQLANWATGGAMEPDAAAAVSFVSDYLGQGNDLSDCHFILIGAGSAMGPFGKLLEMGANIIALDIPGSWGGPRPSWKLWQRLINMAKTSPGSITFPLSKLQTKCETEEDLCKSSGANLMEQPAQIRNWLVEVVSHLPKNDKIAIGNYTYLDGDLHVKLAIAADICIQGVRGVRSDAACAFLCTPTDIQVVTDESRACAVANYGRFHLGYGFETFFQVVTMFKRLKKNFLPKVKTGTDKRLSIVDGMSVAQGPNYALAKRLQHWRAQMTFEEGAVASTRVAPSTATISVMSNKTFQWAYFGMPYFVPFEIFKQETTNAVMCALLVGDMVNPEASKNPKNRKAKGLDNTLEIFKTEAVHGGLWRCGYQLDTIGEASAMVHFLGGPKMFPTVILVLSALFCCAIAHYAGLM